MSLRKVRFGSQDVEVVNSSLVYSGFFKLLRLKLKHKLFNGGWTETITRERVERGHACAAVLYDPVSDSIALLDQFRVGAMDSEYGPWCLEVVAGMVEVGETPEQVIYREIHEEAGVSASELLPITSYYSSPGGTSEVIHLYCALCDLRNAGGVHGLAHENEDILLSVFPADDVFADMFNSRMNNAATLIGLQWLQAHKNTLRDTYQSIYSS